MPRGQCARRGFHRKPGKPRQWRYPHYISPTEIEEIVEQIAKESTKALDTRRQAVA